MFCDTTFSAVPTFCRVATSLCRPIHIALDQRARSWCCVVHRNLGAPNGGPRVTPGEAPRFRSQEACFGSFFSGDVTGTPADYAHVDREIWRRTEKERMDVATGRTWTSYGWSQRWHAREYLLNEYWQIFVDDRLVPRDAINSHANVQPKAVFSYAMTVMDKICGWGDEQQWIGSLFAACMWIQTKAVLCVEHDSTQEYLKTRMLSIMESVNWVCEDALEEHEWVSPLTISLKKKKKKCCWRSWIAKSTFFVWYKWGFLWFTAPSRLM